MNNIIYKQGNIVVTKYEGPLSDYNLAGFVKQISIFGKPNRSYRDGAVLNTLTLDEILPAGQDLYIFGGNASIDRTIQFFPDGTEGQPSVLVIGDTDGKAIGDSDGTVIRLS